MEQMNCKTTSELDQSRYRRTGNRRRRRHLPGYDYMVGCRGMVTSLLATRQKRTAFRKRLEDKRPKSILSPNYKCGVIISQLHLFNAAYTVKQHFNIPVGRVDKINFSDQPLAQDKSSIQSRTPGHLCDKSQRITTIQHTQSVKLVPDSIERKSLIGLTGHALIQRNVVVSNWHARAMTRLGPGLVLWHYRGGGDTCGACVAHDSVRARPVPHSTLH